MTITFQCDGCGRQLRTDDQYEGQSTQCPSCKAITVVPVQLEVVENVEQNRPAAAVQPPPLPADGKPPALTACPECGTNLGRGAVLCIECGFDLRTGQRRKTKKRRLKRKLDRSVPLAGRIIICACAVLAPLCAMIAKKEFIWWLVLPSLFIAAAFATPYGYVFRITLRRDRRGDLLLKQEFWVCLLPLGNWTINLTGYTQAWTDYAVSVTYNQYGHAQQHERYMLEISGEGKRPRMIYDGADEDLMRDLADMMQYDAGMQIKRK
jgi:hypothetical protein